MRIQTLMVTMNWYDWGQLTESSSDRRDCSNHEQAPASEVWIQNTNKRYYKAPRKIHSVADSNEYCGVRFWISEIEDKDWIKGKKLEHADKREWNANWDVDVHWVQEQTQIQKINDGCPASVTPEEVNSCIICRMHTANTTRIISSQHTGSTHVLLQGQLDLQYINYFYSILFYIQPTEICLK